MNVIVEFILNVIQNLTSTVTAKGNLGKDFLNSNYWPIQKEIYSESLNVIGKIPKELHGAYIRNGPNSQHFLTGRTHLFQGDGMLHAVTFKQGKISYNNHFVKTDAYISEKKWGHHLSMKLSMMRGRAFYIYTSLHQIRRYLGIFKISKPNDVNNGFCFQANTSIQTIAGRLLALHEVDLPFQVRLFCGGVIQSIGYIRVGQAESVTAHPHIDYDTKETFFFRYKRTSNAFQYGIIDPKGYCTKLLNIDIRWPTMTHDFSFTKKFAIFLDLPLVYDFKKMVKSNRMPQIYLKGPPSRFGLLPRYSKNQEDIKWFELPHQFIFHIFNAWDVEGQNEVIMYACKYTQIDLNEGFIGAKKKTNDNFAILSEYKFNLDTGVASQRDLLPDAIEYPQINQRYYGKKCQYLYASYSEMVDGIKHYKGFIKYDISDPQHLKFQKVDFGPNRYGDEMYFANKYINLNSADAKDEDAGYLMGYIHDYSTSQSSLVLYDAKLSSTNPIAEILIPQRIPFGFHGLYLSQEQLQNQSTTRQDIDLNPF